MEIKATLQKPYEEEQRVDFIIEQNHQKGYEIRETETELQAWDYTEEEKQAQEQIVLAQLHLTKREIFLAIYQDKNITPEEIRNLIQSPEGLIEFDYAEKFYRGNPLVNSLGQALGYTTEQIDYLFRNKRFS